MSFYLRSKKPGAIHPKRLSNKGFEELMMHAYHHGFQGERFTTADDPEQSLRPYLEDGEFSADDAEALALALHRVDEDLPVYRAEEFIREFRALLDVCEQGAFEVSRIDSRASNFA